MNPVRSTGASAAHLQVVAGSAAPALHPEERTAPRRRDHLQVVRKQRRQISSRTAIKLGIVTVIAVFFGLAFFQTILVQNQFRIDRLDQEVRAAEETFQKLRLEAAQLSAPDRIVAEAKEMGMVEPPGTTYLTPEAPVAGATSAQGTSAATESASQRWSELKQSLGATP